jgi:hypothetical protein
MLFTFQLFAQKEKKETVTIDGHLLTMWITESGDTLLIANLDEMSVSSPRKFRTDQERLLYERYRRYAIKVYPYAVEAIKVFREVEYFTQDMNRRDKKKRIKELQDDLEREFEEPLKKLTKTQGYVLMKMIERELDTPMHDLVKNLRGGFTATYWSTLGWFYGHQLGEGYHVGEDPILDIVLDDFDISYSLPKNYKENNFEDHFFEKDEKKKADQKSKKN